MDKAAMVAASANVDALKEPRGFMKCIQVIIAIFAFATTTSVSTSSSFTVNCADSTEKTVSFDYGYPFRINQVTIMTPVCNGTQQETNLHGNYGSAAEFYVFVGVMAFLYSLAAIILYVFFDEKYRKFEMIPIADFVISCVFTLLWLISSSAWADGVRHVKYYTDPEQLFIDTVPDCAADAVTCTSTSTGNFASLNVSLIFGFLNMAVWGANLWFLFKETRWHKVQTEHPEMTPQEQPQKV